MFTYDDIVRIVEHAPAEMWPGELAWVIGITLTNQRRGSHFDQFPDGTIYLVEFEGGAALDIHENMLEAADD